MPLACGESPFNANSNSSTSSVYFRVFGTTSNGVQHCGSKPAACFPNAEISAIALGAMDDNPTNLLSAPDHVNLDDFSLPGQPPNPIMAPALELIEEARKSEYPFMAP